MGVLFWPAVLILAGVALLRKHGSQGHRVDLREHLPDGARVKEGLNSARRHIPIKRPRRDRMLLGVCAGLAHALDIDPAIVRILFALFSLGSLGTGVILYVILAILMPEEKPGEAIEVVEAEVL
ncbi:MAG: PspC domain-containing protein [Caldilineae bacterium]|nr:MAG: PspC domain-containing protein [Caldilineae bacterium]